MMGKYLEEYSDGSVHEITASNLEQATSIAQAFATLHVKFLKLVSAI